MPPKLSDEQIRSIMREELAKALAPVHTSLEQLTNQVTGLKADIDAVKVRQTETESALSFQNTTLEHFEEMIDKLKQFTVDITTNLAMYVGDLDTHSRKWSLILQGIPGVAGETEQTTRNKCGELGTKLGVSKPLYVTGVAACHRLSQSANAGIILRFTDLGVRNEWLSKARHLKPQDKISISPDIPPKFRHMKTAVLDARKTLTAEEKRTSKIKHLPSWPYVELSINGNKQLPVQSKLDAVIKMLNIDSIPSMKLPSRDP